MLHLTTDGIFSNLLPISSPTTHHDIDMAHEMQDVIVSAKHLGTRDDQDDMERSGRKQDTKRVYSLKTIAGFVSNLIATPEVILTGFQLGLANGGTAGMFWGFLFVVAGFSFVYASLSELTSMVRLCFQNFAEVKRADQRL